MFPEFSILGIHLYAYPIFLGAALAIFYYLSLALNEEFQMGVKRLKLHLLLLIITGWLGAKLLFFMTTFSGSQDAASHLFAPSFWLGGGLVFYGAAFAGFLYLFFWKYMGHLKLFQLNIFIPSLVFAHSVGRVGCLFAGCCYGKEFEGFGSIHLHGVQRYPVQLYESLFLLFLGIFLFKKLKGDTHKEIVTLYVSIYALGRFGLEFFRGDKIRGLWFYGLSTSQVASLILIFLILIWKLFIEKKAKKSYE